MMSLVMNIIFIGGLFPKELRKEIETKSIGVIQYAADALQWALIEGLDRHVNALRIFNLIYIGSFPTRYKDIRIKKTNFSHNSCSDIVNIGFINLPIYKLISRYWNLRKELFTTLNSNYDGALIIYAIHIPFLIAAIDYKQYNKNIKICLIVPDLPQYMNDDSNIVKKYIKRIEIYFLRKYLPKVDAFVLLSDHMATALKVERRPWVRIEGVINSRFSNEYPGLKKEILRTVLYSGTLARRYGILNLLEAFSKIKDPNYRLWVCGDGDTKEILEMQAKVDHRIVYFGQLAREEVLRLQIRATVLVNPRSSDGEYTKFSFPSKTMEYLASGTPCVMYKLPAIPEEYHDYIYFCEEETPVGLSNTIAYVCEKNSSDLKAFGERAKQFVMNHKSSFVQGQKIYNLIKQIQ